MHLKDWLCLKVTILGFINYRPCLRKHSTAILIWKISRELLYHRNQVLVAKGARYPVQTMSNIEGLAAAAIRVANEE